ncbi:hypothetical protein C4J99_1720 [Pseudomonas synxantha]|nr:hypothetical protein C4J99_1720 [Pseudomonas synxantha]
MSCSRVSVIDKEKLIRLRDRLYRAIDNNRSDRWCLALWSRFIRARDTQCVVCNSDDRVQAHHIFRRTLLSQARYELGNGITLCYECHKVAHEGFNGRPDMTLPIGAQGGDDQDEIAFYYRKLLESSEALDLEHDEFFTLSDGMLRFFVRVQGYEYLYKAVAANQITGLVMACKIWVRSPEQMTLAILRPNLPGYF